MARAAIAGKFAGITAGRTVIEANTYIGNAPDIRVKAIDERYSAGMSEFFGIMWCSALFLLPSFAVITPALFT